MRAKPFLATLLAAAALSGCASDPPLAGTCPATGFVAGLERATVFAPGGGTEPSDIAWSARMGRLDAACELETGGATVAARFAIDAERGPAGGDGAARPYWFVAIAAPGGEILAKEVFSSEIPFEGGRSRAAREEEVAPFLPARRGGLDFAGYRVLIGFQLTPEQVERNRAERAR